MKQHVVVAILLLVSIIATVHCAETVKKKSGSAGKTTTPKPTTHQKLVTTTSKPVAQRITTAKPVPREKILMLPESGFSHVVYFRGVADLLKRSGYDVHFLIDATAAKNVHDTLEADGFKVISYEGALRYDQMIDKKHTKAVQNAGANPLFAMLNLVNDVLNNSWVQTASILRNEGLMSKLRSNDYKFALCDNFFHHFPFFIIPQYLKIPYGGISSDIGVSTNLPILPSINPALLSSFTDTMSFTERFQNFIAMLLEEFIMYPKHFSEHFDALNRDPTKSSLVDIVKSSDLFLVTRDPVGDYPNPSLPNTVNIGNPTSRMQAPPMPAEYQKLVDGASDGVLLLSMGTRVALSKDELAAVASGLGDASARLRDRRVAFVLQGDPDTFPVPKSLAGRVIVSKFIPQTSILAHDNVRAFITHCGNSGQYEALRYGRPMIGIPLAVDQYHNAARIPAKGWGFRFEKETIKAQELSDAIYTLMESTENKYAKVVRRDSILFNDISDITDRQAVDLIRHVIKYGSRHLRTAASEMGIFQYYCIDILLTLSAIYHLLLFAVKAMVKKLCCKRRVTKEKTE